MKRFSLAHAVAQPIKEYGLGIADMSFSESVGGLAQVVLHYARGGDIDVMDALRAIREHAGGFPLESVAYARPNEMTLSFRKSDGEE
jgi:hypothetical protein